MLLHFAITVSEVGVEIPKWLNLNMAEQIDNTYHVMKCFASNIALQTMKS